MSTKLLSMWTLFKLFVMKIISLTKSKEFFRTKNELNFIMIKVLAGLIRGSLGKA
jgi:hypothetical protein